MRGKFASLFEIRWLDSQFQSVVEHVSVGCVQRGVENYVALTRGQGNPDWQNLVTGDVDDEIDVDDDEDLQVADNYEQYDPGVLLPTSLEEVEAIHNLRFEPTGDVEAPADLYQRADESTLTSLRPEYIHLFEHSASSSFFAYLPLYFWRQVLFETNKYAVTYGVKITTPFTLAELMAFLGILFYMALNDKGEYANYWGQQPEDKIFGGSSISLDSVMSLNRFKLLRRCLSFNAVPVTLDRDAAARIRPLLNLLKVTGGLYINVGRNVALDEASVACRSRQGRHMIVFNPMKPTGKYHFRFYVVCCSSTWIALNFKLHCNRCDIGDRLEGVVGQDEAQSLRLEFDKVSKIRQHVLEVVRPLFGTKRIVNMDNYYTSVQLLQELELKGLYGRGTIKSNSKHFPRHTILDDTKCSRGDLRQAISRDFRMIAASWCDGDVVNMVSNADASTITPVTRMVGNTATEYAAPTCIGEYNQNMQGVDRLDQIRTRFSIADGHSYKRWHKKLALAMIDIARSNANLTRRLAKPDPSPRDPHRDFVMDLASELMNGKWTEAPSEGRMIYGARVVDDNLNMGGGGGSSITPTRTTARSASSPPQPCTAVASKQIHDKKSRKRRRCIVCRWEDRYPTEVTTYCLTHAVCLCREVNGTPAKPWVCPQQSWTCWDKVHKFYLPQNLFTQKGNIRRGSLLLKLNSAASGVDEDQAVVSGCALKPEAVRQIIL